MANANWNYNNASPDFMQFGGGGGEAPAARRSFRQRFAGGPPRGYNRGGYQDNFRGGSFRGGPRGFRQPWQNNNHRPPYHHQPQGGNRGFRRGAFGVHGNQQNDISSYFHPSMLEDPWGSAESRRAVQGTATNPFARSSACPAPSSFSSVSSSSVDLVHVDVDADDAELQAIVREIKNRQNAADTATDQTNDITEEKHGEAASTGAPPANETGRTTGEMANKPDDDPSSSSSLLTTDSTDPVNTTGES